MLLYQPTVYVHFLKLYDSFVKTNISSSCSLEILTENYIYDTFENIFLAVKTIKGQELHAFLISSGLHHQKFFCGNRSHFVFHKNKKYKFGAT